MVTPEPDESGRGCADVRLSPYDRGAIGIGYSSLLIVTCDRVKNLQNLIAVVTLTKQRDCKVESHFRNEVSVNERKKFRVPDEQEIHRIDRTQSCALPHPKS